MELVFPGERLVIRLWETLAEKGIGSLLKPWQMRREGRAQIDVRREELLALAQAEREAEEIRSGRKSLEHKKVSSSESVVCTESKEPQEWDLPRLLRLKATDIALADIIRREVNVARALLDAEAELQDDTQEPPSNKINEDWLFRWRDCAGSVSAEELQTLWGRLLAGELKSPGTFSFRTLECIRNLSQEDANQISLMYQFVIDDFIFKGLQILEDEGITFDFLLFMQQIGVLMGVEAIGITTEIRSLQKDKFSRALLSNGRVLVVAHDDPNKVLVLPCYKLTRVGREILKLGNFVPHETYLRRVGEVIAKMGFNVDLASYKRVDEKRVEVFDSEKITANSAPQEKETNE